MNRFQSLVGTTLVELLVALTIMGLMFGLATLESTRRRTPADAGPSTVNANIRKARDSALRSGTDVTVTVEDSTGVWNLTALPDGSIIGDSPLLAHARIDPLSGRRERAATIRQYHAKR